MRGLPSRPPPSSALAARAHASSPLMWSAIALTILHGSALGRLSCTSECQVERLRWAVRSCIAPKISACLPSARLAAVRCCGVQRQGRPPGISICDALPDAHTFGAVYAASPWRHNEAAPRTLMQRGGVQEWLSTAEGECAARGLRLFTVDEASAGTWCKSGCGFDNVAQLDVGFV